MYDHVLTDAGLKIFDEDHKTTFSSERVGGDLDAIDGMQYNFVDDGFLTPSSTNYIAYHL